MKISSSSWHFRLWAYRQKFFSGDSDDRIRHHSLQLTLCSYFWSVIWTIWVFFFFYAIRVPLGYIFGLRWVKGEHEFILKNKIHAICVVVFLLLMPTFIAILNPKVTPVALTTLFIYFIIGVIVALEKLKMYLNLYPRKEDSFYNVTKEFIKAKKAKVCPNIEVIFPK